MQSIVTEQIRERGGLRPEDDKFRYHELAGYLLDYILSKDFPISMGIYGKWGSGKTVLANFMEQVADERNKNCEDNKKVHFFKFDVAAFKNSGKDIFWYFIASISKSDGLEGILKKLWGSRRSIFWSVLKSLTRKYAGDDGIEVVNNYLSNEKLRKDIIKNIGKDNEIGRNIIIIDNLDRLQPIETIAFLEQLKSFLLVDSDGLLKNFAYLILCDFDIIAKEIREIYNNKIDVRDYLNKIIEVPFYLPSYKSDRADSLIRSLTAQELPKTIIDNICSILETFNILTPRDIKNFLLELDMIFIVAKSRGQQESYLIENLDKLLAVQIIKVKYYNIFNYLDRARDDLCKNNADLFDHRRLVIGYERKARPGHSRNLDMLLDSSDPNDISLVEGMKLTFDLFTKLGLISKSSQTACINKNIDRIFQMIDDVTLNYKLNVNDKVEIKAEL